MRRWGKRAGEKGRAQTKNVDKSKRGQERETQSKEK
jgi:hypothetical protein